MLKCVILIGGPLKGTRFRPLSFDLPKPLFPIAGFPMIYHHIEACARLEDLEEIILIGFYQMSETLSRFIASTQTTFQVHIRYLQEYNSLGTAGGLYHFRDQILLGDTEKFFVFNVDVCCDFPLKEMMDFHKTVENHESKHIILTTEATRPQSLTFGCVVEDPHTHVVKHYVEKPTTFVSTTINCGVYLFTPDIFKTLRGAFVSKSNQLKSLPRSNSFISLEANSPAAREILNFEQDVFKPLAEEGKNLFAYHTINFWSQVKTPAAAIYANRHLLNMYQRYNPERLAVNDKAGPMVVGDVFIHPSARVHPTAKLGPNVSVGQNVIIGPGVRIRESIILDSATIQDHSCVLYSVIGWNNLVGTWTRVEGTPNDPNPNKPFAKLDSFDLFNDFGKLNPSITVIGAGVHIPSEVVILNCIVLPSKHLQLRSYKNQIIL